MNVPIKHRPVTAVMGLLACALLLGACGPKPDAAPTVTPGPPASPAPTVTPTTPPAEVPKAEAPVKAPSVSDAVVTRFKAYGFSPAWQADINGDQIEFDVPETTGVDKPLRKAKVTRLADAKGVNFDGQDGKVSFTLDVRSGPCDKATDNGKAREFHATFTYGKSVYKGCADAVR